MMDYQKLDLCLESYYEEALETMRRWVRQPSVKMPADAENAPFGPDNRKMLDIAMADAQKLGFDVKDIDGYAAQADLGEGEDLDALGILGHLDIVPVGDGWTQNPYGADIVDGKVYGRGTSDDKGYVACALYAMAAVKKAGIPLKRKVRLIMGCDEETGMEDMRYYRQHATMPRMGFSPDASYPVINIEKGGCVVKLSGEHAKDGVKLKNFNQGERINVIPGNATAQVYGGEAEVEKALEAGKKLGVPVEAKCENGVVTITTVGKTGHAAMGEDARNAIGQMLIILRHVGVKGAVAELSRFVGMTYYGENLGIAMEDRMSGKLTCSLDIIRADEEKVEALCDIRYPLLYNPQVGIKVINMTLNGALKAEMLGEHGPHFVSENSDLVKGLLAAYEEVTGEKGYTIAIGGGTYARTMEEGVAFGGLFPGQEEMAHQADEYIGVEDFYRSMKIFAYAIVRLCAA
ncbi:MAG: Sapep family Mn(2+)-dependent dipeptidase [Clostridia bacterium]|nr:Sapep family Mn(2+)-dependent dipeptidase [Clostridia bacterium]